MQKISILILLAVLAVTSWHCGEESSEQDVQQGDISDEVSLQPDKDKTIQEYNLEQRKKVTTKRYNCDTIALMEYILANYDQGTYLMEFDKRNKYQIPPAAVIYTKDQGQQFVLAVFARSRPEEKAWPNDILIEPKTAIGYDASFNDLDSTRMLGTPFLYLKLLRCETDNNFTEIWSAPIPRHGGFNWITMERWKDKNIPYLKANFHYARGVGHFDFNYFFIRGLQQRPHLLLTYEGINFSRVMVNLDNDLFPDFEEAVFLDTGDRLEELERYSFTWSEKDSLYVNTKNKRLTIPY